MGDMFADDIYVDVRFDFEGALRLARNLCAQADALDALRAERLTKAETALGSWLGPYATEFAGRVEDELAKLSELAAHLRFEAEQWAVAWTAATDQQLWKLYARRCKEILDDRGWGQKFVDHFNGVDLPPEPQPAQKPSAPDYLALCYF